MIEQEKHRYRVRRGWGGVCVLQVLMLVPSWDGAGPDCINKELRWFDVEYDQAPRALTTSLDN